MDRTVFAGVSNLHSGAGLGRVEGNRKATQDFVQWIGARGGAAPFFATLWYNHSDLDIGAAGPALAPDGRYAGNPEAAARWLRYRRGLAVIDGEVAKALAALEASGRSDDTIVFVMGDHGFEFDDLGLGYYAHATNYGRYQLQTPLWMHWPGREPRRYTHRSSHLDLPATLLTELLGCRNPPADYSLGRNLFDGVSWDWIIAGSYHSYAIVEPGRIVVTSPGGFVEVLGDDYRTADDLKLDPGAHRGGDRGDAAVLPMKGLAVLLVLAVPQAWAESVGVEQLHLTVPMDAAAIAALGATECPVMPHSPGGRGAVIGIRLPAKTPLVISATPDLVPEEYAGFGDLYSNARAVAVEDGEQRDLAEEGEPPNPRGGCNAGGRRLGGRAWTLPDRDGARRSAAQDRSRLNVTRIARFYC